jgi:hypothetical protein
MLGKADVRRVWEQLMEMRDKVPGQGQVLRPGSTKSFFVKRFRVPEISIFNVGTL